MSDPIALGRSVVVGLGDAVPSEWSSCKRIRVASVSRRSRMSWGRPGGSGARSRSSSRQASVSMIPKCLLPMPLRIGSLGVVGRPRPRGRAASPRRVGQLGRRTRRLVTPTVALGRGRMQTRRHPHRRGRRCRAAERHGRRLRRRPPRHRARGSRWCTCTSPDFARARDASAAWCE